MAYTARQLITQSWYLSGIVSQEFESEDSIETVTGLNLLNSLLALKTVDKGKITYYTTYEFDSVAGQETYFIPNLVSIDTLTFTFSELRWGMQELSRDKYFGYSRPQNIQSIPSTYNYELILGGANISLYFIPNLVYTFQLVGKFSLAQVTLDTDLSTMLATFYIEYLRYALAQYMCQQRNIQFRDQNEKMLMRLESLMVDVAPLDLSLKKISAFSGGAGPNWGIINLSHGWFPGSWQYR